MNKENKLLTLKIHLYLDSSLIETIKVSIDGKKDTGDYQFSNVSDFFRSALLDFKNNKNSDLTYLNYVVDKDSIKKRYTFRISEEIKKIFDSFKDREWSEITEKILGTYKEEKIG